MNDRPREEEEPIRRFPKITSIEVVLALGGVGLLFTLLYATQTLLSPFAIIIALFVLLYPLRTHPAIKNIMGFAFVVFMLWLLKTIEGVLAPFAIALILSYLLHPVVTRVERWNVPRWASAFFIIACALALIILLLMGVVPLVVQQFGAVLQTFSTISTQFTNWMMNGDVFKSLRRYGVSNVQLRNFLTQTFAPRMQDVLKTVMQSAFGLVSEFSAVVTGIVNIVIIPFLTFFILKDFPLIKHRIKMLVPKARRPDAVVYFNHIDDVVGRYLRGTMIIALFDATMVSTLFWLIGIPYPAAIGLMSGILSFFPYFGFLTMIVITIVASSLGQDEVLLHMVLGLAVVSSLHIIETYVLSPKIIGTKVGLHPVLLILSLLVFGYFLGFIGLIIAIPAAGSIVVIAKEWETRHKQAANGELFDTKAK